MTSRFAFPQHSTLVALSEKIPGIASLVGSVGAFETKRGRRFRVQYRRPDNRQTQKRSFTTKRAAQQYLAFNVSRRAPAPTATIESEAPVGTRRCSRCGSPFDL